VRSEFVPFSVASLDEDVELACDLYVRTQRSTYLLFLAARCTLAPELRRTLARKRTKHLYVASSDADTYSSYVLARAERMAAAEDVPAEKKAGSAYHAVSFTLERVLHDPRADTIHQLEQGVRTTVGVVGGHPQAARTLMRLTRHDMYTYNHSMNVGVFGLALALSLGEAADWTWTGRVAEGLFLHDIGKARVCLETINWPGQFSAAQWAEMRRHPEFGLAILQEEGRTDPVVLDIVYQHHERHGGTGYPRGLTDDAISLGARICAITDVFDALTTSRPYRRPLSTYDGIRMMLDEMQQEFDPDLFGAFIHLFEKDPTAFRDRHPSPDER
jgi:putative nucleotidyltransferase with HDIG domain